MIRTHKALLSLISAILIIVSTPAYSFMDVKSYRMYKGTDEVKSYVTAAAHAYGWANSELRGRNQSPLYCENKQLVLNADNYITILEKSIQDRKGHPNLETTSIELLLLKGLQDTFPCK
jgi:hypothetical protein